MSDSGLDYSNKRSAEIFPLEMDFSDDLDTSETIDSTSATTVVTVKDNADADVTATIIVTLSTMVSDDGKSLIAKVQAGSELLSPYVMTFKGFTTSDNVYEAKIRLYVKDS